MLKSYRQAWAAAPYAPTFVTVDLVLRCADHVLLIQRAKDPGQGLWALPGGFVEPRDTLYQSAVRELEEETGLRLLPETLTLASRGVAVFDHPDRSQRGRTISHTHYFDLGERELPEVQGADDAARARWVPVTALVAMEEEFFDDHFHMLDRFLGLLPAA
jgi:bifunctional NMN adenylyltransferase/nudix hydrolase